MQVAAHISKILANVDFSGPVVAAASVTLDLELGKACAEEVRLLLGTHGLSCSRTNEYVHDD